MKFILAIVCGLLFMGLIWIVTPLRMDALDTGDKTPLIAGGYISKLDLKKKVLTVRGYVVSPGTPSQTSRGETVSSFQTRGGGRGGGGRGPATGSPGGGRGAGRGGGTPEEEMRIFSVYVRPDTVIQNDKEPLTLTDLRVQDYVMVLGTARGKSINIDATSISVSNQ